MAIQRHYLDQLMLSLFDKEATYDAGPGGWLAANACSMLEFDDASAHTEWNDLIVGNEDVVLSKEFADKQEIARQDVRINYTEPRVKPNTLAGLVGLTLGTVASTQDAALTAYRHKLTPANAFSLPSIGAQTKHESGRQYDYKGVKSDGYSLSLNDAYLQFASTLIGSGTRAIASDTFPAAISEDWHRWGDAKVFVKDTAGTPITDPGTPVQGSANLGGSEVELSSRVMSFSHEFVNGLQADLGYRSGSAKVRGNLHPGRRSGSISIGIEVDSATEAAELDYYLNQAKLALEVNLDSGTIIAATGAFKFGLIMIIPLLQLTSLPRGSEAERETLTFEGKILDDGTNAEIIWHVFNAQSIYLA